MRGKGYLEVTRTGAESAMERLAVMLGGIEAEKTPLERRLTVFGEQVARWVLGLAHEVLRASPQQSGKLCPILR